MLFTAANRHRLYRSGIGHNPPGYWPFAYPLRIPRSSRQPPAPFGLRGGWPAHGIAQDGTPPVPLSASRKETEQPPTAMAPAEIADPASGGRYRRPFAPLSVVVVAGPTCPTPKPVIVREGGRSH